MFEIDWHHFDGTSTIFGGSCSNVAALAILFMLLFFCITLWQLWNKTSSLNEKLDKAIETIRTYSLPMSVDNLQQLDLFFKESALFEDSWREFQEALLKSNGKAYSTSQAERYFSDENIIENELLLSFYTAVPGLLTSIGLMGTFLSIYVALMQLPVEEGQVMDINPFIHTLSGKFLASIFGLLFAFVFVLIEKNWIGGVKKRVNKLRASLNAIFESKPQEHILDDILTKLAVLPKLLAAELFEQPEEKATREGEARTVSVEKKPLDKLAADTSALLADTKALAADAKTLRADTEALRELTKAAYERRDDVLSGLVEKIAQEFRQALTEAASEDITKLATALANASSLTLELRDNVEESLTQLRNMVSAQREQLQELLKFQSEQCELVTKNQTDQFEKLTELQSSKVNELLNSFNEEMKQELLLIETACKNANDHINEWTSGQEKISEEFVTRFKDQSEQQYGLIKEQLEALFVSEKESAQQSHKRYREETEKIITVLSAETQSSVEKLNTLVQQTNQTTTELINKASRDFDGILANSSAQNNKAEEITTLLQRAIENFTTALGQSQQTQKQVSDLTESLLRANEAVASSEIAMRKSNNETKLAVKSFQEQIQAYQNVLQSQHTLWLQQKEALDSLENTIGKITEAVKSSKVVISGSNSSEAMERELAATSEGHKHG